MKTIKDQNPKEYLKPFLLYCEGASDLVFFRLILKGMNLLDKFEVEFPGREGETGGKSKFGPYLGRLRQTSLTFRENVCAILLFTDSDNDPESAFKEVRASLATQNFLSPSPALKQIGTQPGMKVFITTIPCAKPGSLETLCLKSAYDKFGLEDAVEHYISKTNVTKWSVQKREKAKIHIVLASTCEAKPETSLAQHWKEHESYHISVDNMVFDEVGNTIQEFVAMFDHEEAKAS